MIKKLERRTVVIVGGGLTAGLMARQLTAQAIDVLVLERGGDHTHGAAARLPSQRDELRWGVRQGLMQKWNVQTYSLRHSRSDASLPVRWMEAFLPGEGMGGAASHWNGHTWRWAGYDPTLRTRYAQRYGSKAIASTMPLQDWGVTYEEMEPYHDLFEKLFGLSGTAGNVHGETRPGGNPFEAPRRGEYPQKALEITEAGLIFKQAAEKMGYHPFPIPAANSSGVYTNPDGQKLGQCQYCGHCERFICEAQAKASADVLLYPMLRQRKGFELRLHSHVLGVNYERQAQRVTGVRYVDGRSGKEYEQPADVVVLGAFTMTNNKLLMLDEIGVAYDPLTGKGVVGRNFCYQTNSGVGIFMKDRWINPFLASGSTGMVIDDFNNDNFDHTGLGFLGGGMISASVFNGRPITARRLPPGTARWGTRWKQANADWYAHSFGLSIQGSCYPDTGNFLDLDPVYKDAYGQPLVRMTFDWRDNEMKMSAYVTKKMDEIAKSIGADIVSPAIPRKSPFDTRIYQSTHVTGGTPMGTDPATSVVTPHLQHWDAQNLFVVGASVFQHNSGYNPTGPLAALALRLGDDLVRYVQRPRML
ncbi:GMC family oxidoreductase [Verminephrobacter eiseniae]|uniref:Glucose-methanol-choline oxidoreductase n=1 Tax=Verminephrobacter eiseniae (strain EF01-2) TaxID=391735 RepID=A1WIA0_VEREI|nr:GMC family oxidoreductase [Verminephrobacter eiseniae]ABM57357.1 glucose-methanol-choline oxidoreductase [Verminephrobacter eiseniae EF01-2]MCW5282983.1 GMC family oxidoreductase [Verminephrobacter eiseniae]MCW5303298.1 GMC family oxidoreductase [Verminephrobacter eiseniae]MCW8178115.1 GMC family oxidoreductase [Verminephrobacter eiseniae]MCW8188691.1 GMC family oxidoreductase [Verminephrobacter eiseniae]